MRITSKGQVTIPKKWREKFGFWPGSEVDFIAEEDGLKIVKKKTIPGRGGASYPAHARAGNGKTLYGRDYGSYQRGGLMPVLVDSNVILDVFTEDPKWFDWSAKTLAECAEKEAGERPLRFPTFT